MAITNDIEAMIDFLSSLHNMNGATPSKFPTTPSGVSSSMAHQSCSRKHESEQSYL